MFSTTLLFVLGGCVLGAIQLVAGIAIGMWLRQSDRGEAHRGRQDMVQASEIARRLAALADEMSSSAYEHRSQLDKASQMLTADDGRNDESLAELVVDVIGDIVRANQNLQSKLETAESRLEEQAAEIEAHISRSLTDPLTGLPNRREFDDRMEERMSAWNRRREAFSLVLLDVDHFKRLNDEHGHLVGDQVLAAIGRALRCAVRREDAVARYGGEEFAILLPSSALEQAVHVVEKVRGAVAAAVVHHHGGRIAITVSAGLATIAVNERAESLIERADSAMYAAKAAGRDRGFVHDGTQSKSIADFLSQSIEPGNPAAELVAMINSPEAQNAVIDDLADEQAYDFGTYLQREVISDELALTCEELRQYIEQRGQGAQQAAPTTVVR